MAKKKFDLSRLFLFNIPLVITMILVLFPFLWAVLTSFKTTDVISGVRMGFLPDPITFSNYVSVWQVSRLQMYFGNSIFVSLVAVVFVVILSVCNGYALGRYDFKMKNPFVLILLGTQFMPSLLFIIPLFVIFSAMKLTNNLWAVIIVYVVMQLPFNSILMKSFVSNIPIEIEEAAWVDGAGRMRTVVSILLPLLAPGIGAISAFAFVGCWNEFLIAFSFVASQKMFTIPVGLRYMIGEYSVSYGSLAAGSIIALIIPVCLFAYIQRFLVGGLSAGAVKG